MNKLAMTTLVVAGLCLGACDKSSKPEEDKKADPTPPPAADSPAPSAMEPAAAEPAAGEPAAAEPAAGEAPAEGEGEAPE